MPGELKDDLITGLDFVDEQERVHFATAQLGEQVRAFLPSPVGRYLHGRAKQQLMICQEEALKCNPDSFFGRRKLKGIQHDASVAKAFIQWCVEAIQDGEMSIAELDNYR